MGCWLRCCRLQGCREDSVGQAASGINQGDRKVIRKNAAGALLYANEQRKRSRCGVVPEIRPLKYR